MEINIAEINIAVQNHLSKKYGDKLIVAPIMYSDKFEKDCGFCVIEKIKTPKGESEYRRLEVRISDNGEYPRVKNKNKKNELKKRI